MPTLRYIMLICTLGIGAIGYVLLDGNDSFVTAVQKFPALVHDTAVKDGVTVTVRVQITPRDNPDESYNDTEQFIQGQHTVPEGIELRVAGMHSGEIKTFSLSAEEGFGPRDETKLRTIPTVELPPNAQEGDIVADDEGRYAEILLIRPELTVIDLNHPLAGQPLLITLQVVMIEDPDARNNKEMDRMPPPSQSIVWRHDRDNEMLTSL